jgi:DNA-binding transcriptional LysR family regulator
MCVNIRFLETFVWLARLKNFRAAAEKLNTTQPNISSRIGALEDQLRTRLYVHGAKDFQLTASGRRLLEYAESIVQISNEMHRSITGSEGDKAVLRVGVIELATLSWLPNLVKNLQNSEELSEIDFVAETSGNLLEMLRRDELDLAFVWGPAHEPDVVNDYICNYAIEWLGSPIFCNEDADIDIVELARLPVIPMRKGTSGYVVISEYFAAYGIESLPGSGNRITMNAYSIMTAIHMVRAGIGVMAMAPFVVADDIARGDIKVLPVRQKLPPAYLTACYKSRTARPAVQRLIEMTRAAAKEFATQTRADFYWI